MTNIVQFPRPEPEAPHYLSVTTLIDPNSPLDEGDVVAWHFENPERACCLISGLAEGPSASR